MRFSKEQRQAIIREFAVRHNGHFNPRLFRDEVRATGPSHPAYGWFTWDAEKAADEHQVWQARQFANGLRVTFSIEEVGRDKAITVRQVAMPFAISPTADRDKGGGYFVSDPDNPEHMQELCRQASVDLARWLRRYQAALVHAGGSVTAIERQLKALEAASPQETKEAA